MKSIVTLSCIVIFLCTSLTAQAQFFGLRIPKYTQRMHIGYSYAAGLAKYEGTLSSFGVSPDSASYINTGLTNQTIKAKAGYGFVMGTYFPLTNFGGRKVGLALSTDFAYNFLLWEQLKGGYYDDLGFDNINISGITLQAGLPIGLDLKFGAEATTSKNSHLTATIGAGVNPMYSITSYEDNIGSVFSPSPYIKLEGGIRAGIFMKLRVLYTINTQQYISKDGAFFGSTNEYTSNFTLTGRSSINVTLLFMPFSWMWDEQGWWNGY